MLILHASNIKKHYSDRLILGFDELTIYSGDKIGIVGRNGSGKTTLMNILSGAIEPDEGLVKQFCELSYIRQFSDESIEANPKALKEFNLSGKTHQIVFSGGERTRIKIANALSCEHLLLFADEPTANLDDKGIELLKKKLNNTESFVLISHDRFLLDHLCNRIIEVRDGKLNFYSGNYTFYKEQNDLQSKHRVEEYEQYISEKVRLADAIHERQCKSKSIKKAPSRMGNSEARLHKRKSNEKRQKIDNAANGLKTRLEKLEVKEKPRKLPKIKLDFSLTNPPSNKIVISSENLTFSYGDRKIFNNAKFKIDNGKKTAVWGENGIGKTTLLNLISGKMEENIYVVPKAKIGYFHQGLENLDDTKSVLENVMKDSVQNQTAVRTILSRLLIAGDDVYKNVDVLSGGERMKVSFAKLVVSDANVLLLDEPTNYLDMESIEALENVLLEYEGTLLFVSHDSAFVNNVANTLLIIGNQTIHEFDGTLQDYKEAMQKPQIPVKNETERIALQMRMTEIISKLSMSNADKEALEAEYQRLVFELRTVQYK